MDQKPRIKHQNQDQKMNHKDKPAKQEPGPENELTKKHIPSETWSNYHQQLRLDINLKQRTIPCKILDSGKN